VLFSCQLLLAPEEMARFLGSSNTAAATQLGDYLQAEARAAALHATQTQQEQQLYGQAAMQQQLQHQQQQQQQQHLQLLMQQLDAAALNCQQDIDHLNWQTQQQQQQQHQAAVSQFQQPTQQVQSARQMQQQHQQQPLQQQQHAESSLGSCSVPLLNLSRVKMGSSSPVRNLPDGEAVSEAVASKDAELCFEGGSIRQHQLHPAAPLQDSRCYIYRAVGRKVRACLAVLAFTIGC
jgi:myosin heavy subunit